MQLLEQIRCRFPHTHQVCNHGFLNRPCPGGRPPAEAFSSRFARLRATDALVPHTIKFLLAVIVEKLAQPLTEYEPSLEGDAETRDFLDQLLEGINADALCLLDTNEHLCFLSLHADTEKARDYQMVMQAKLSQYLQQ